MRRVANRVAKRLTGKSNLREAWREGRRRVEGRIHSEPYGARDLRAFLERLGVGRGRVVHFQSSWNEFYNFDGRPTDLINELLEAIGPSGTLVMPASPLPLRKPVDVIDFRRVPSQMGLVSELFRRYPGVQRSVHRTSSVCALGPAAEYLVRDHQLTETAWDPASPFGRMRELDALQVSLGLYPFWATPLHCIDAVLRHELEFHRRLFPSVTTYRWRNGRGEEGVHSYFRRVGRVEAWRVKRHYDRDRFQWIRLGNLRGFAIEVPYLVDRGIELARRGVTIYLLPRPTRRTLRPIAAD